MVSEDLLGILPESIIALGGFLLLLAPRLKSGRLLGLVSLSSLALAFDLKVFLFFRQSSSPVLFYGILSQDRLSFFLQLALLATMALTTLGIMGYAKEEVRCRREVHALILFVTTALLLIVGAQHLALVYLGLEMVSLLSYLLVGSLKKETLATEAGLKYFLFGSLATGVMLYGISLIYGLTGTMDLPLLAAAFPQAMKSAPWVGSCAIFLLIAGIGFKVALVPFHMWAPDVYEGAPTPVAAFISVGPKIAGFAVFARIFLLGFSPQVHGWTLVIGLLAVLTMTIGNVVALVQTNVKRLLAYSSIAQAGYMAVGIAVGTPLGLTATLYYLLAYLLMNLGAFLGVIAVGNATGREDLAAFAGLSRREPALSFMITVALLSLAGIPPMAGFFAKLWIFGAALQAQSVGLAVVAAVNSVIALFYYVKVIKCMYLDPAPAENLRAPVSRALRLGLILCVIGLLIVGLYPGPWWVLAGESITVPLQSGPLPWL